jgi:hypothetical protein
MHRIKWSTLFGVNIFVAILVGYAFYVIQSHERSGLMSSPSTSARTPNFVDLPFDLVYNTHPYVDTTHWVSWALLSRRTGVMAGSDNWAQPTYQMSMIKPWIAADYFNSHPSPSQAVLDQLSAMIEGSNDQVAYQYFSGQPSWDRLVKTCGLTELVPRDWSWSLTEMSARDAVRYGDCIYSGKTTSPEWTAWIVDKMRHVQGEGDFGPRELLVDRAQVATKNGWYNWEGKWYVNCLAITDRWVISILQQFPYAGGALSVGIAQADPVCKSIANQVLRLS